MSEPAGRSTTIAPDALAWIRARREEILSDLSEWVRIPSVAGTPDGAEPVTRSARWLTEYLTALGFPTVETWSTDNGPAVWAEWPAGPDAPRVLVYSHHDVRTVAGARWQVTEPFDPLERDGRLYGRGTSDAKGQVLAHLWGLRWALPDRPGATPPVTVMLLIEGEEEVGSPNLADLLDRQGDRLAADLIVFSDTMGWSADTPAVCLGVRGLIDAELEIRGALEPVHAGAASGVAPNPAVELSRIVGALHDDRHRIAVPRFYDDVDEISPAERAALAGLTGDEQEWLRRTRTRSVRGEAGRSIGERLYTRPTVEILAMTSGADVKPTTGAIPASAKASLHVSLVPDQHPDAITPLLREWVDERMPPGLDYEFTVSEQISQPPYLTPADHPALPVLVDAMAAVWQAPVAQMRNGGSGPARLLADRAGADVLFFGTGLPEDAWHSSDESVHIETLLKGAATLGLFWSRIGAALSERPS